MAGIDTLRGSALALFAALLVPACGAAGGDSTLDDTQGTASAAAESAAGAADEDLETAHDEDPYDRFAERETLQDPSQESFDDVGPDPEEALSALEDDASEPSQPEPSQEDVAPESAEALAAAQPAEPTGEEVARASGDDVAQTGSALTTSTNAAQGTVTYRNARGETIKAHWQLPPGSTSASRHPAVIVMHGSGGMHKMPSSSDTRAGRTCSNTMESQFPRWADRLTKAGYAVLIPDSWEARGYCDENDPRRDKVLPPRKGDENGKARRLLWRLYDQDAGARWLCTQSRVRCDRIATLGFSNGGSAVMLGLHHKINDVLRAYRDKVDLNFRIPLLPGNFPFKRGIAYYPGCGFDGIMHSSKDSSRLSTFYYPRAPLRILMGENDSLIKNCAESEGSGIREYQADKYASSKGLPDRYTIKVFDNVGHGYDSSDCSSDGDREERACYSSRTTTMSLLSTLK